MSLQRSLMAQQRCPNLYQLPARQALRQGQPVFNRAGLVAAALNASTSSARADKVRLNGEFLLKLKAMAGQLTSMLP
jgi:DNA-binding IclR family transcriptional regulator